MPRSLLTVLQVMLGLLAWSVVSCESLPQPNDSDSLAAASPDSSGARDTTRSASDTTATDSSRTSTPDSTTQTSSEPVSYTYRVEQTYPHDHSAWTQGLVYADSVLYEGTGLNGRSSLRKVDLETGEVLEIKRLDEDLFGEGIALLDGEIFQLTWRAGVAFVYNQADFEEKRRFSYDTEGWGLTHDGERLIMSDGSATIYFRDPETFQELGSVEVRDASGPIDNLNELEYIDGQVYANIWLTERIVRFSPDDGKVTGWIDLEGILDESERPNRNAVLNGIAYDPEGKRLFVTGKLWPKLFEIELLPQ